MAVPRAGASQAGASVDGASLGSTGSENLSFKSLEKRYAAAGYKASCDSKLVGDSGTVHGFSFSVCGKSGPPMVVADALFSPTEAKVLGFYAKSFDVKTKSAVLCVSPRLRERPADLAKEYHLIVVESESPSDLPALLSKAIDKAVGLEKGTDECGDKPVSAAQ